MILNHHRRNHEATDDLLNDLDCILVALDVLEDAAPMRDATPEANAAVKMRDLAREKMKDIEKFRSMEWVGLGGVADRLSETEVAKARGEESGVAS